MQKLEKRIKIRAFERRKINNWFDQNGRSFYKHLRNLTANKVFTLTKWNLRTSFETKASAALTSQDKTIKTSEVRFGKNQQTKIWKWNEFMKCVIN